MNAAELRAALSEMVAARSEEVEQMVRQWGEARAGEKDSRLDPLEVQVREWVLSMGRACMERLLHGIAEGSAQQAKGCPQCGGPVHSEGMRGATVHTSMGDVPYGRRYFACGRCQEGFCPLDVELGLDEQHNSPALQRMASLAGTVGPFEKGSELLGEIGSIPMGAQKVEQITEQAGGRAEAWLNARQQRALAGLEVPAGPPAERLYVEADGTTVPMRAPAGQGGQPGDRGARSASQRTPGKVEYKEVKLGAIFEAKVGEEGKPESGTKTYTGTFGDAQTCIQQVRAEAKARGSDAAKEVVVLCDGGTWLWNRLPEAFPGKKVTQILDCRHPEERLTEIGKRVFGEGSERAREWSEGQRRLLHEGMTREMISAIEQLKPKRKEAKEYVRQSLGYLRDNEHRMNYGELRAQGYFIGSGVIESSCKHVVGARFKQAGMSWSPDHSPKVLALRVCRASGWWNPFWSQSPRAAA